MFARSIGLGGFLAAGLLGGGTAYAQLSANPPETAASLTQQLGIEQKIGNKVVTNLPFKDETGKTVTLDTYLGKRPLMVVPIELGFEGSAGLVDDSIMKVLSKSGRQNKMILGRDFDLVLLSIDPKEISELALAEKRKLSENIDAPTYYNPLRGLEPKRPPSQPGLEKGLHVLTGTRESIVATTDSLGFKFKYSPTEGVLASPLGAVYVSPQGQVTGYSIGREIVTKYAESNLADAAANRPSPLADEAQKFALYKPSLAALRNRPIIENVIKFTGWSTLIALIASITYLSFKYRTPAIPDAGDSSSNPGGPAASA
jgi:protein SCO1/2